jgi:6-pyruvoyl-tetrahydropterin synthase
LNQHKELEEFIMDIGNVYQTKNEVQRQFDESHTKMDKNLERQMVCNEKLQKLIEEA